MPQLSHCHPDLFALDDPPVPLAEAERIKLLPLVSALLTETLAVIIECTGAHSNAPWGESIGRRVSAHCHLAQSPRAGLFAIASASDRVGQAHIREVIWIRSGLAVAASDRRARAFERGISCQIDVALANISDRF
jgi:hypothetical protein